MQAFARRLKFRPAALAAALLAALAVPASAATTVWDGWVDNIHYGTFNIGLADELQIVGTGAFLQSPALGVSGLLQVQGLVTASAQLALYGANVVNNGVWNAVGNVQVGGACCSDSSGVFYNNGTVRQTSSIGRASFGAGTAGRIQFDNSGVIDAQAGVILFNGESSIFRTGTRFTGAGVTSMEGSGRFEGAFNSTNLQFNAGAQLGVNALINGNVQFNNGQMQGQWEVASGSRLVLGSAGGLSQNQVGGTLVNRGTLNFGSGIVNLSNGSLVNNGSVQVQDGALTAYYDGGSNSVVNNGVWVKASGTGDFKLGGFPVDNVSVTNTGTLDVRSGSFTLPNNFVNNGRMQGTGSFIVGGVLTNAGHVAPGNSPGTLSISGSFAQGAGGFLDIELGGAGNSDLLRVSGDATLGGTLVLHCWATCSYAVGQQIVLLDADGSVSGTFDAVALEGFAAGAFSTTYEAATGRVLLTVTQATLAAVPEPRSTALLLAGLVVLGWVGRRHQRA